MKPLAPDYKQALYWALGLHFGIIVMMLLQIDFPWENKKAAISYAIENVEIVQAHTVSQASLDAQAALKQQKLRQIEAAKQQVEKERLAKIEKQKQLELAKKEEAAKKEQAIKQAELAKQQEAVKKAQAEKQAELAKQAELKKQAELADQAELAKQAELAQAQAAQQQADAEQAAIDAQQQAQLQQAHASEVDRYALMVKQKVQQNWLVQHGFDGLYTELLVRVSPSGTVLNVQIIRKSGNDALDRSAVSAVNRASPLPVPTDPAVFESFREIQLILRPEDVLG